MRRRAFTATQSGEREKLEQKLVYSQQHCTVSNAIIDRMIQYLWDERPSFSSIDHLDHCVGHGSRINQWLNSRD